MPFVAAIMYQVHSSVQWLGIQLQPFQLWSWASVYILWPSCNLAKALTTVMLSIIGTPYSYPSCISIYDSWTNLDKSSAGVLDTDSSYSPLSSLWDKCGGCKIPVTDLGSISVCRDSNTSVPQAGSWETSGSRVMVVVLGVLYIDIPRQPYSIACLIVLYMYWFTSSNWNAYGIQSTSSVALFTLVILHNVFTI